TKERIGEVHEFVIRTPADPIRYRQSCFHVMNGRISIKAVKTPARLVTGLRGIAHCSCPKTPLAVDCSIVKACMKFICFRICNKMEALLPVPKSKAALRRHDQPTGGSQSQSSYR